MIVRYFESPLEQIFFFFFFFLKKDIFYPLFTFTPLFFALVYFSFSYLHNLDFFFLSFFFFKLLIDLHVISIQT